MSVERGSRDPSADRLVVLGSAAVRPVLYTGITPPEPFPVPVEPIAGLLWQDTGSRRTALYHGSQGLYGFLDLEPGPHRLQVTDPRGRFLPRAWTVTVPDRRPLAEALARGATTLPEVEPPPLDTVPLRPAPGSSLRDAETSFHGVVRGADGRLLPFAWIRVTTDQGVYVTSSDLGGSYVAPLPFLRPQLPPGDTDEDGPVVSFSATVRVHALLASPLEAGSPLDVLPAGFDTLVPGTPDFNAVYDPSAVVEVTRTIKVGTKPLLNLEP